jgi:RNA polymerase sigma factor (TIGR02999 family)
MDRLLPIVYAELHRLAARARRRERPGRTLQTTALVHEAYLRIVDQRRVHWRNRGQFFAVAAQAMRRILVDEARRRTADKRGGGAVKVSLSDARPEQLPATPSDETLIAVDQAVRALGAFDPDLARLVELRYFAGLSIEQTADALGVSAATVGREWAAARAWLAHELRS